MKGKVSCCCDGTISGSAQGLAARCRLGEKDCDKGTLPSCSSSGPSGGGGHLCQGGGLACAPCSDSGRVCPVIPSAVGAEAKRPVRHSLSCSATLFPTTP